MGNAEPQAQEEARFTNRDTLAALDVDDVLGIMPENIHLMTRRSATGRSGQ